MLALFCLIADSLAYWGSLGIGGGGGGPSVDKSIKFSLPEEKEYKELERERETEQSRLPFEVAWLRLLSWLGEEGLRGEVALFVLLLLVY